MGALRALVQAWGSWCQDPEWTQEPFVDEEEESVQVLVDVVNHNRQSRDVVWAVSALCVLVAHEPVQHLKSRYNI